MGALNVRNRQEDSVSVNMFKDNVSGEKLRCNVSEQTFLVGEDRVAIIRLKVGHHQPASALVDR